MSITTLLAGLGYVADAAGVINAGGSFVKGVKKIPRPLWNRKKAFLEAKFELRVSLEHLSDIIEQYHSIQAAFPLPTDNIENSPNSARDFLVHFRKSYPVLKVIFEIQIPELLDYLKAITDIFPQSKGLQATFYTIVESGAGLEYTVLKKEIERCGDIRNTYGSIDFQKIKRIQERMTAMENMIKSSLPGWVETYKRRLDEIQYEETVATKVDRTR